ncbi:MAG: ComEC/Rec2 family competence protein, partial [Clostridia bacterium]|nr:ComEC/Rec2 family competence protein [Clostridia bacterium]
MIAVFIGLGVGLFHIAVAQHQVNFIPEKKVTYGISGVVDTNYIEKEKGVYFILSDAKVINNGIDQDLNFNVFVYMYYPEDGGRYSEQELEKILPGNFVYMTSKIVYTPVFDDEINTFAYSSGFQYSCFTNLDNVVAIDGKMGFWDSIREHIRGMYKENMDEIYAGLAFSILVGDKTELDPNISNNFAISGIIHVIAVSGLNTAFIVMLLMFFLKKLRIKWLKLGIVLTVLVFYAILCDLTPSVVRASLMSIFLLITHLFGKQGDNLTSI